MHRLPLLLLLAFAVSACDSSAPKFVEEGATVTMAYEGRLSNGDVFDSSPSAEFVAQEASPTQNGLITGFYNGILGLAVGDEKTFDIPPDQAYGSAGVVNQRTGEVIIPPNETLTFAVTVLNIQ